MQGVSTVLVAVLIVLISAVTGVVAYQWAAPRVSYSFDLSESQAVMKALESCNDRIVETARVGSSNKCIIPASRGTLTALSDGLYYVIASSGRLCDPTNDWVSINPEKHIELSCRIGESNNSMYNLRWRYPKTMRIDAVYMQGNLTRDSTVTPIVFTQPTSFRTVSVFVYLVVAPGETGQNVDLTRKEITVDNVTLGIKIY